MRGEILHDFVVEKVNGDANARLMLRKNGDAGRKWNEGGGDDGS